MSDPQSPQMAVPQDLAATVARANDAETAVTSAKVAIAEIEAALPQMQNVAEIEAARTQMQTVVDLTKTASKKAEEAVASVKAAVAEMASKKADDAVKKVDTAVTAFEQAKDLVKAQAQLVTTASQKADDAVKKVNTAVEGIETLKTTLGEVAASAIRRAGPATVRQMAMDALRMTAKEHIEKAATDAATSAAATAVKTTIPNGWPIAVATAVAIFVGSFAGFLGVGYPSTQQRQLDDKQRSDQLQIISDLTRAVLQKLQPDAGKDSDQLISRFVPRFNP
jgi:hypothetical protein